MADQEFVREALTKALKDVGPEKLSARLRAPPTLIQAWISGHATMPDRKLGDLMDVLGEIDNSNDPRK